MCRVWRCRGIISRCSMSALCTAGRFFPRTHPTPGSSPVVVLSHQFWQSAFAGDPAMVGRTIRIADRPFEVVGVGPPISRGRGNADRFLHSHHDAERRGSRSGFVRPAEEPRGVLVIGRLRPDVPLDQAKAALTVWIEHATEQWPESDRAIQATLESAATPLSMDGDILRHSCRYFCRWSWSSAWCW